MNKEPTILAHRGLLRQAPENTSAAYISAFELGFGIEVDVRFTADKELVMLHDTTLDRTTNGQGELSERSYRQIASLDAGSWFHSAFAGQAVPTFSTTCELAAQHGHCDVLLGLDIKEEQSPIEQKVCRELLRFELMPRVIGIGNMLHSEELRGRFKAVCADFPAARRVGSPDELEDALGDPTADFLFVPYAISAAQVAQTHQAGKQIFVVGAQVQDFHPENWRLCREVGADVLCTDYAIECQAIFRERDTVGG